MPRLYRSPYHLAHAGSGFATSQVGPCRSMAALSSSKGPGISWHIQGSAGLGGSVYTGRGQMQLGQQSGQRTGPWHSAGVPEPPPPSQHSPPSGSVAVESWHWVTMSQILISPLLKQSDETSRIVAQGTSISGRHDSGAHVSQRLAVYARWPHRSLPHCVSSTHCIRRRSTRSIIRCCLPSLLFIKDRLVAGVNVSFVAIARPNASWISSWAIVLTLRRAVR